VAHYKFIIIIKFINYRRERTKGPWRSNMVSKDVMVRMLEG
jgi:hypothetical protein